MSLGVVSKDNPRVEDLDSLIQAADEALYQAKVQGRNRLVLSNPDWTNPASSTRIPAAAPAEAEDHQ